MVLSSILPVKKGILFMPKQFYLQSGLIISLACHLFSPQAISCTRVFWNNNEVAKVAARSTDLFTQDSPLIKAYPRGTEHQGEAGRNSLKWKSRYGNVVVTEFHTNAASDGINEKGLSVHLLYLADTKYPETDPSKPQISNVLWSQYLLDNYATVNEALNGMKDLQIVATEVHNKIWPLHLTMEDASGDSAVVEYVNGKMQVYHGPQYQIMTNEPAYDIQLANLKRYRGFGGHLPLPGDPDPLSRFVRVATFLKTLPKPSTDLDVLAGVLSVMRTAMVPFGAVDTSGNKTEDAWATRWITLSDLTHKIYYFSSTTAPNILWIDLNKINFAEGEPVLSIDPSKIELEGDISKKLMP
ncbi:linear amide C-N hydrolase [Legionella septentrionalis]|nr:linear amide C-N hydrolase [Legionella septentrionalis]RUR16307.1 linear amide C-N hydrolase [Legionella septentrionalis]